MKLGFCLDVAKSTERPLGAQHLLSKPLMFHDVHATSAKRKIWLEECVIGGFFYLFLLFVAFLGPTLKTLRYAEAAWKQAVRYDHAGCKRPPFGEIQLLIYGFCCSSWKAAPEVGRRDFVRTYLCVIHHTTTPPPTLYFMDWPVSWISNTRPGQNGNWGIEVKNGWTPVGFSFQIWGTWLSAQGLVTFLDTKEKKFEWDDTSLHGHFI